MAAACGGRARRAAHVLVRREPAAWPSPRQLSSCDGLAPSVHGTIARSIRSLALHRHERARSLLRSSPRSNSLRGTPSSASPRRTTPTPNPRKVNLGVGVYCDENGKVPLLECVKRAEREMTDIAAPRSYLPIDGIPAYDREVRALLFGADADAIARGPRRDRAGAGRHRRAQGRRRFPAPLRARRAGMDQRSELGKPSRAVRGRGLHRQYLPVLRPGDARPRLRRHARRAGQAPRRAPSSCCTRAATIRPASTRRPRNGRGSSRSSARAGSCRSLDLAYQGFGDGIDADGAVVRELRGHAGPAARVELVLEVVLAVRRARRRAVRRRRRQGRGGARAVAAEAR